MHLILFLAVVAQFDLPTIAPDDVQDRAQVGATLFVALKSGGVAVFDVTSAPKLVQRFAENRQVVQLIVRDHQLITIEAQYGAATWSLADPTHPVASAWQLLAAQPVAQPPTEAAPAPASSMTATAPVRIVHVVEVRDGRAIFDAGLADGFAANAHVRIISQRLELKPDLTTGATVKSPSGETTAIVRVEQAEAHRSMAWLGRGDVAEPGDLAAITTDDYSERLLVPRRAPFAWLAGFRLMPFLGLESITVGGTRSKPVGFLIDLYGSYYFESVPLAVSVSAAPVGFAIGASEPHYPMTFSGTLLYVTDYFEIGLGVGGMLGNKGPCLQETPDAAAVCEVNSGFTINQQLRLGALDGINLVWRSSIFSRPDRFVFGLGRGEINVPLTSHLGLFGAGGAGENGWASGEFGVRTYLGGVGGPGTLILSASLGYASIFDGPSRESIGGPSVAFGLEWRR